MATLLEQIQADNAVFLDAANGFADTHDIDGVQVAAVIEPLAVGRADQEYPGMLVRRRRLFASSADLAAPVPGQVLRIDGEDWSVEDVTEDAGLLDVMLLGVDS